MSPPPATNARFQVAGKLARAAVPTIAARFEIVKESGRTSMPVFFSCESVLIASAIAASLRTGVAPAVTAKGRPHPRWRAA
jgi:hypothetical protein